MTSEIAGQATDQPSTVMPGDPVMSRRAKSWTCSRIGCHQGHLTEAHVESCVAWTAGKTGSDSARRWASVDLFGVFLGDGNEATY